MMTYKLRRHFGAHIGDEVLARASYFHFIYFAQQAILSMRQLQSHDGGHARARDAYGSFNDR